MHPRTALLPPLLLILFGIVLASMLESEVHVTSYSGPLEVSVDDRETWSFRYLWLNLNSTAAEELLGLVCDRHKILAYKTMRSGVPATMAGIEEWVDFRFTDPPAGSVAFLGAKVKVIGLNITGLTPDNATIEVEVVSPRGEALKYVVGDGMDEPLPRYIYAKVLERGVYMFKISSSASEPVTLTLRVAEGVWKAERPYLPYGVALAAAGLLLGVLLAREGYRGGRTKA